MRSPLISLLNIVLCNSFISSNKSGVFCIDRMNVKTNLFYRQKLFKLEKRMLVTGKAVYLFRGEAPCSDQIPGEQHTAALLAPGLLRAHGRDSRGRHCPPLTAEAPGEQRYLAGFHARAPSRPRFSGLLLQGPLLFQRPYPERFPRARPRPLGGAPLGRARHLRAPPSASRGTGDRDSSARAAPAEGPRWQRGCGPGRGSRRPPSPKGGAGAPRAGYSLSGQDERLGFPSSCRGLQPALAAEQGSKPQGCEMCLRLPAGPRIPLRVRAARNAGGVRRLEQPGSTRLLCSCTLRSLIRII